MLTVYQMKTQDRNCLNLLKMILEIKGKNRSTKYVLTVNDWLAI